MAASNSESWQMLILAGMLVFILYQMLRGWQLGVVRVMAKILAVVVAYASAWVSGPKLFPVLRPLGLPDPVLMALGGVIVGLLVFIVLSLTSALLFKKTADQSVGIVRLSYGAGGAFLGMLIGGFLVWIAVLGVRLLGTLAAPGTTASHGVGDGPAASASGRSLSQPSSVAFSLTQIKQSLERGPAGAVMEQIDPIPSTIYTTIEKIGLMVSDEQRAQRFMQFSGVAPLIEHPKMLALRDDPTIARDAFARNYLALIRNPKVISLANDPEIRELLQKLEFQKALDYAVSTPDNRPVPHREAL